MKKLLISIILCTLVRYFVKNNLEYLMTCMFGAITLAAIAVYLEGRK
jgi:hypothetical protein